MPHKWQPKDLIRNINTELVKTFNQKHPAIASHPYKPVTLSVSESKHPTRNKQDERTIAIEQNQRKIVSQSVEAETNHASESFVVNRNTILKRARKNDQEHRFAASHLS